MITVLLVAFFIFVLIITLKYLKEDEPTVKEKPYTETICGECGGPDCIMGCDNPTHGEHVHSHKAAEITSASFIKREKEHVITDDEIRYTAYLIASNDNFSKDPEIYWHEAVKQLKGE